MTWGISAPTLQHGFSPVPLCKVVPVHRKKYMVAQAAESCRDAIERDIGFLDLLSVILAFLNPVFGSAEPVPISDFH